MIWRCFEVFFFFFFLRFCWRENWHFKICRPTLRAVAHAVDRADALVKILRIVGFPSREDAWFMSGDDYAMLGGSSGRMEPSHHRRKQSDDHVFRALEGLAPGLGSRGLALLVAMLRFDPSARLSAAAALAHPFFVDDLDAPDNIGVVGRLARVCTHESRKVCHRRVIAHSFCTQSPSPLPFPFPLQGFACRWR